MFFHSCAVPCKLNAPPPPTESAGAINTALMLFAGQCKGRCVPAVHYLSPPRPLYDSAEDNSMRGI